MISEMGFESYFLIVWDFVKYAKENGIAVGPGPRLGRRLDRRLRPRDHRHRPARQRPALRALPQPRPQVDARHRHRLLGPRPRAGDPLRRRQVRPRVRRPDHHLRQDGAAGRHPRRRPGARLRLRDRRPARQADPRADPRPQPELRGVPEAGRGAEAHLRLRPGRAADPRHRPGPRGDRPQPLDPRRGRGDRRPAAAGDRPAAARRGPRRGERQRERERQGGARLQDGHPVLDGPDRGDRPAEDGLPRPAQPRRDRGRGRDHRALPRREDRHQGHPARRPQDLRDARSGGVDRRLPVRVRRDARRASRLSGRPSSRTWSRSVALYRPGAMRYIPRLRQGQARPRVGPLPRSAAAPDHRVHLRLRDLPGAAHGDRQADGRLQPRPRPTTCARRSARRSAI